MKANKTLILMTLVSGCTATSPSYCPPSLLCAADGRVWPDASAGDTAAFEDLRGPSDSAPDDAALVDIATPSDTPEFRDTAPTPPDITINPDMLLLPASCQEILTNNPNAKDGVHVLYVARDPKKSWEVTCVDFSNKKPKEYLSLPIGRDINFGQYTAGGSSPGTSVRTTYAKIRIDPSLLLVDVGDETFATSTGQLMNSGGPLVTSVAYGAALDCAPKGLDVPMGIGNIDLRGTPFAVKANAFSFGPPASSHFQGKATYSNGNQVVNLLGGGHCGGLAVGDPWPYGNFDIPVNHVGGFYLQLEYR